MGPAVEVEVHCDGREAAGLHTEEDREHIPYFECGMDEADHHCWEHMDGTKAEAVHVLRMPHHDLHRTAEAALGEAMGRCLTCRSLQLGE